MVVIDNLASLVGAKILLIGGIQVGSFVVEMEDVEVLVDCLRHVDVLRVIEHQVVVRGARHAVAVRI